MIRYHPAYIAARVDQPDSQHFVVVHLREKGPQKAKDKHCLGPIHPDLAHC